jgi:asparagine N-glycosylation enzyme membrane subunit Stt3
LVKVKEDNMLKNWKFLLDCLLIIIVGVILCTVLDLLFKTSTPLLGKIGLGIFAIMIIIARMRSNDPGPWL